MKIKALWLSLICGFIISLDQATKIYVHTEMELGQRFPVWGDFLGFTSVRNYGAAFGALAGTSQALRHMFFMSIPPLALILILSVLRGVERTDRLQIVGLSFIFAGALGNFVDRIRFGFVVDFIDFNFGFYHFPTFNIADISIVVGVAMVIVAMIQEILSERS